MGKILPIRREHVSQFEKKGKFCQQLHVFLNSDLHSIGVGTLPKNIKLMTNCMVRGRHILQVDEVINIAAPLKNRFGEKNKDRMLKLHLTDGVQQVIGLEYRYISNLKVNLLPGLKVAVTDVFMRQGILMLRPENVEVLGGSVPRLIKAQERVKASLTKDPRPGSEKRTPAIVHEAAEMEAWREETIELISGKENSEKANEVGTDVPRLAVKPVVLDKTKNPVQGMTNQKTILSEKETVNLC